MDSPARTGSVWAGTWVTERLGVRLPEGEARGLVGLALRRNPRRSHLLVSTLLGKHVPQRPGVVREAGLALGRTVRELLGPEEAASAVVLGYAETATALGHCVADGIGPVVYLHSTRRAVAGVAPVGGFEEEHSHATSHLLLPERPEWLVPAVEDDPKAVGPLVLVDDEFSTGRTVANTLRALHALCPRDRYVVVTLLDLRDDADRAALSRLGAELGTRIDVVAAVTTRIELPDDVLTRGQDLVAREAERAVSGQDAPTPPAPTAVLAPLTRVDLGWPLGLPDGGRHGFLPADRVRLEAALPGMARRLAAALTGGPSGAPRRVLVLGCEELMYAPLRLAAALEDELPAGTDVRFSSTTRSPVLAVDDPGYAIRTRLSFRAPTDGSARYVYNVAPGADPERRFDAIVVVADGEDAGGADTARLTGPGGLTDALRGVTDELLLAVVPSYRPRPAPLYGPAFSSYRADEVAWLLKDLSDVTLEAPTEEREEAIQRGGAHYAESLPVEYQPSADYQNLYQQALTASAARVAHAVGVVTETVLAERGRNVALASLARAGTPVGVLMRRWARQVHGLELPHYAVSIVRGRGIDLNALRHLARWHRPEDVVFVDGWTGKGAITRELTAALAGTDFDPALAVLADPGRCVRTFGTRDDFLIPSACLNSTVSGLVSRTVLRADLIGPDEFHGAKFYRELAGADVSGAFLDQVAARFDAVRDAAVAEARRFTAAGSATEAARTPDWSGWAAVERISAEYGIGSVNLVKPGVGETTRVLLRRVPWRVLVRRGVGPDLDHVRLLASQRAVPVEEVDDLPYSCVGLIHPDYTRGATGSEGTSV
ncbi:phosphoribosyltransferase [Streptacidiphilus fuscans]|uniref:Phosphoribosyltransferase n=1 Tax=Streptacidiphilus fuscans TaxID=2789292 RepID=A0A931B8R7_9ACTN|nr:phosphoribosyltransferase [Streptacidiphilus fuscans]MBF9073184.1 phosphoribosyltransferase [Streptacidiphilus fuscans]